jgi:hypothetical protein
MDFARFGVKILWVARGVLVRKPWGKSRFSTSRGRRAGWVADLKTEMYRKPNDLSARTGRGMGSQRGADLGQVLPEGRFGVLRGFHAFAGMQDRAVVPAAEELGDRQ